jgi:hypothetical protein
MDIAAVEQSFADLLAAYGDLVVARARGGPVDPAAGSTTALVRRYRARRREVGTRLESLVSRARGADIRALANMAGVVAELDAAEPTPGVGANGDSAGAPAVVRERAAVSRRYGAAATAVRIGSETIDRLTLLGRLASEPDEDRRRELFLALAAVWRMVDGDGRDRSPYRHMLAASAARWDLDGSPIEANARALGLPAGSIEATLREILATWRTVAGSMRVEPWDWWWSVGAAARRLDGRIDLDRMIEVNRAYLASLGADPDVLGITYDVQQRAGRPAVPVAFTQGMGVRDGRARPPWVFANYARGSFGNLVELVHESGHAVHYAAIRARPAFAEWTLSETAFLEGTADVLGWDATEPAWQRHWLGEAATPDEARLDRYGPVMLDIAWALFELELHRNPTRRPNDVWTELTAEYLGIEPHPEWSWWAMRGQLVDEPGYMANYALSAIIATAVRTRTREIRGDWLAGDPGWYATMKAGLFAAGASRTPAELLDAFLGSRLTAEPLLAAVRRDARAG